MYKIVLLDVEKTHEYEELIKIFLRPGQYEILSGGEGDMVFEKKEDKNLLKQEIYDALREKTGMDPLWGIVTGIRPVKMTGDLMRRLTDRDKTIRTLRDYYRISEEKINLVMDIYDYQKELFGEPPDCSVGIYIGIPFCPSRCYYCSFPSNSESKEEMERYLSALHQEIDYVASLMKDYGYWAESIYIGGGTPTTLGKDRLDDLLAHVKESLWSAATQEFTLEAGRPDTITKEKLQTARDWGVDRISINPQTMKDETLERIGRGHSSSQVADAFQIAREVGIPIINGDIIAGLPGEDLEDFYGTLHEILKLEPENLTVHSLAVKRTSRLAMEDKEYHYRQGNLVTEMLDAARKALSYEGYRPYYLYRQKHMPGAQENIGYCKEGTAGRYNVRIMDEHQTILALGAGGVSKIYYPKENHLDRVPNVNNYQIYVERLPEMLERKREKLNGGKKYVDQCTERDKRCVACGSI